MIYSIQKSDRPYQPHKIYQQRRQIQQNLYGLPQYPDRSNPVH
ncbi:MAG: hypothetical protein ACBR21_10255 [Microcoleus sp.]